MSETSSFSDEKVESRALLGPEAPSAHGSCSCCHAPPVSRYSRLRQTLSMTMLGLSVVLFVALLWALHQVTSGPRCLEENNIVPPSPAREIFEHSLEHWTWESEYMGEPGPETDALWLDLVGDFKAIPVSPEVFYQVNTDPESGLKVTGTDDYVGLMDGPHQLHCVDILRRSNYYNMPHYRNGLYFANHTDEEVQWHIHHCIEILRQAIMCHGDTSFMTWNWVEGNPEPVEQLNTVHSCQNWDTLQQWSVDHDITDRLLTLERPEWVLANGIKDDPKLKTRGLGQTFPNV